MSQNIALKRTRRRVYLFHGDGLVDMAIGMLLLSYVFATVQGKSTFMGVWIVLLLPLLISIKSSITAYRIDQVEFSPPANAERRLGSILVAIVLLVALIVIFGTMALLRPDMVPPYIMGWITEYGQVGVGVVLASLLVLLAWALGAQRLYAYAVGTVLVFACGFWLSIEPILCVAALGTFILVCGILILFRFVRTYRASPPPA